MVKYLESESLSFNLMEVKNREAQGRHCEVGSEGSVEQKCELTNRNWINKREGWTSWFEATKSISIKDRQCKSSSCALKVFKLTLGDLIICRLCADYSWEQSLEMVMRSQQTAY